MTILIKYFVTGNKNYKSVLWYNNNNAHLATMFCCDKINIKHQHNFAKFNILIRFYVDAWTAWLRVRLLTTCTENVLIWK